MPQVKRHNRIAATYAESLLELAAEIEAEVAIGAELEGIGHILKENAVFQEFLSDPTVSINSRAATVRTIFSGRIHPLLLNVILLMNSKRRLRHLSDACYYYQALLKEKLGKVDVDVTVAQQLDPPAIEDLRTRINQALKLDAILHQHVDDSIIGGLILRVGDNLIDGSVRVQLEKINKIMLAARGS